MKNFCSPRLARPALFAATVVWGASFVIMKNSLDHIGVYYLLAIRFSGAALLLAFLSLFLPPNTRKGDLPCGGLCGLLLFCAYALQTEGLKTISAGKNAFLTAVDCVLVPFLVWAFLGIRPTFFHLIAALLGLGGIGFISLDSSLTMARGDLLTLGGGFFFAVHVVALSALAKGRSILRVTTVQFAAAAGLSLLFALGFNQPPRHITPHMGASLLYLCIFATALAFLCQSFGQRYLSPSSTSLILCTEAIFSVFFSFLFAAEPLNSRILFGFALILLAILISEVLPHQLRDKKSKTAAKNSQEKN
ncbi:MAG: DMT family transporter [Ruminococcaceae bacterium]|nr:DMT family transporter [Oscillospiraceae bacterium]